MKHSDELLLASLGSLLSDGGARRIDAVARQLGVTTDVIGTLLAELAEHGLDIRHEQAGTVRIGERFVPLDDGSLGEHLARLRVDAEASARWTIDSTNTALLRLARATRLAPDRLTILCAEYQSQGRGRQGHRWFGAPGASLCVSFAQRLPRSLGELSGLSLVCGIAVCAVLQRHALAPQLKWPNDLLIGGRKLGGILVEVHPVGARSTFAIIGIGLNVRRDTMLDALLHEQSDALAPTDLHTAGARQPVDRNEIIAELADALGSRLARFAVDGFAPFKDEWNALDAFRDREISLIDRASEGERAVARGVDDQGRLCVDTSSGRRSVVAGDVSLRAA